MLRTQTRLIPPRKNPARILRKLYQCTCSRGTTGGCCGYLGRGPSRALPAREGPGIMASRTLNIARSLGALFDIGVVGDLPDGQLLERFTTSHHEAAELAFHALVERHGPMVLRVCRRLLADPNDADDAFQATFLVLLQRAGRIHSRCSVAAWLQGWRFAWPLGRRAESARRRRIERHGLRPEVDWTTKPSTGHVEGVDLEVARLPEKYRARRRPVLFPGAQSRAGRRCTWAGRSARCAADWSTARRAAAVAACPPRCHHGLGGLAAIGSLSDRRRPPCQSRSRDATSGSRPRSYPAGRSQRWPPAGRGVGRGSFSAVSPYQLGWRPPASAFARRSSAASGPARFSALPKTRRPSALRWPGSAKRSVARCSGSRERGPRMATSRSTVGGVPQPPGERENDLVDRSRHDHRDPTKMGLPSGRIATHWPRSYLPSTIDFTSLNLGYTSACHLQARGRETRRLLGPLASLRNSEGRSAPSSRCSTGRTARPPTCPRDTPMPRVATGPSSPKGQCPASLREAGLASMSGKTRRGR